MGKAKTDIQLSIKMIAGPFNARMAHRHVVPHLGGHDVKPQKHYHRCNISAAFSASSQDDMSLLMVRRTQNSLQNRVNDFFSGVVFEVENERVLQDLFTWLNEWVSKFCDKELIRETFYLQAVQMEVLSNKDALGHIEGSMKFVAELTGSSFPAFSAW